MLSSGKVKLENLFVKEADISKLRCTIKQFYRDWSEEGKLERDACYQPIIEEVVSYFPNPIKDGKRLSILNPGCGLGRLPFEFAMRGYKSQGNEYSYFMLIGSNFILNNSSKVNEFDLFPFIHNFSNNLSEDQPFKKVSIPDVLPANVIKPDSDFSVVAGEFTQVYKKQKSK